MKKCSRCGLVKSHKEFQANRSSPDGKRPDCKLCCSAAARAARERDKERIKARKQAYYQRNKERVMEQHREYLAKNPGRSRDYYDEYRKKNRERIAAWWKKTPRGRFSVLLTLALKRRPTESPITISELMDLWVSQKGRCAVTGIEMAWRQGETLPNSMSIDRIDNSIGYSKDNIRLVCYQVNTFRGRWSDEQMLEMAKAIVAHSELPMADAPPHLEFI